MSRISELKRGQSIPCVSIMAGEAVAADMIPDLRWAFVDGDEPEGRVEIWEPPRPDQLAVIGADFAQGIAGRDYDAAVILDANASPPRQIAELHGHWGPVFERLLYAVIRMYDAFLVGESNGPGIGILKRLYRDYGVTWMYYNRSDKRASRPITDLLGRVKYGRRRDDPLLRDLRTAVIDGALELRSESLIQQMANLQYSVIRSSTAPEDASDDDLDVTLATGGSPDLVIACTLALFGCGEVGRFPKPAARYAPGSLGDVLGHDILDDGDAPRAFRWGARGN